VKAIVGAGGSGALADREAVKNTISRAASRGQLFGAINTYTDLMAGQLAGTRKQYETSTGRNDFNSLLFPETVKTLEGHDAAKSGTKSPIASATQTATNPKTGQKIYLVNGKWLNSRGLPVK